jgi:raffinose/stachyose/melibiose transport system substrate-binding protein
VMEEPRYINRRAGTTGSKPDGRVSVRTHTGVHRVSVALAALALVAAACGGSTEEQGASAEEQGADEAAETMEDGGNGEEGATESEIAGDLRVLSFSTDQAPMSEAISAFEDEYPDVNVTVDFGEVADIQALLQTQLAAGSGPDVFAVYPGAGAANSVQILARSGYLVDQSDRPWAERVVETDRSLIGIDDKIYGGPLTALGIGYLYNESAMEEAGLQPPETWSEVESFCAGAADAGKVAYAAGWQTGWTTIQMPYSFAATLVDPEHAYDMLDGNSSFVESGWVDALDMQLQMEDWGCFNESPNGTTKEDTDAMVATGDALGTVIVQNVLPALRQAAPEGTTFHIAAMPATDDASETRLSAGILRMAGLNANASNHEAGQAFIDFLMSEEVMARFAETAGALPALETDAFDPDPLAEVVINFRNEGRTAPLADQLWPNPAVQQEMIAGIQSMFSGQATAEAVAEAMDEEFTR